MVMEETALRHIHDSSLQILEKIGVRLEHPAVLDRVVKAGARPGARADEVRFPPEMVCDCLSQAPASVELASLDGSVTRLVSGCRPVYWTCPVLHVWNGTERREIQSADLAVIARLSDELENIQGVMGVAMADYPPASRDFAGVRIIAENSRKHVRALCFSGFGMDALTAMKPVLPGAWFSLGFTAHGPLRWTHLALDVFARSAGSGIPVTINGEPMAGVSAPVTLAGTIAVGNAEILSGIVINQILEPGRPVIYNLGLAHVFDMKRATAVTGGPENALLGEASAALGRFYGLPSSSWVSTEALFEDEQAALEKMCGFQAHSGAGVSVIWGMGQLESEMTLSLAQLVIDNEMINYLARYQRGITVNQESLALEVTGQVGVGGSFLETEHTLANFRSELFHPDLFNRAGRTPVSRPLPGVARDRAEDLLRRDRKPVIEEAALAELRRIEARFRAQL